MSGDANLDDWLHDSGCDKKKAEGLLLFWEENITIKAMIAVIRRKFSSNKFCWTFSYVLLLALLKGDGKPQDGRFLVAEGKKAGTFVLSLYINGKVDHFRKSLGLVLLRQASQGDPFKPNVELH